MDCSQLVPLSKLPQLTHLALQDPGQCWGIRLHNLSSLSCLSSLSVLATGIECVPGASRLSLHGATPEQRRAALLWAQAAQDKQAGRVSF
jgi:hypothetical protein